MTLDYFSYFSFNAKLEFDKKIYHLKVTLCYNSKLNRKEFGVLSDDFTGSAKLLVYQQIYNQHDCEWMDINNQDNSALVQQIGAIIFKNNI
ncbi:MAG TPA: hypothetical protein VKR32_08050 [Puia sp.]|nr:hypothetical protein [Puia sp.]